ncbi:MAG: transcription termination/antitermination protein NusG [Bacilli bacterium]|jgi:transcriptional antiterminator NusG|nr:transcription termination/antitermination protein NusG [Bacilli bacterium]
MIEEKEESVFETAQEEEPKEETKPVEPVKAPEADTIKTEAPAEERNLDVMADGVDHSSEMQWYVANTYSGHERIVADYLLKRRISMHMEEYINQVVVAEQEEAVIDKKTGKPMMKKNGEIKKKTINLYPGYIFVQAIMSDLAWYIIRNTPGVTGLVGSSGSGTKPFPIPKEDMIPILKQMKLIVPEVRGDYVVGEKVRIIEGAFAEEEGEIISVDQNNAQADVSVTFFGRPTTVTIPFSSLEKAD